MTAMAGAAAAPPPLRHSSAAVGQLAAASVHGRPGHAKGQVTACEDLTRGEDDTCNTCAISGCS